jgi:hypothetical protein
MSRFLSGCILALIIVTSSPARSQDKETCQSCCKEVYATCKEGKLADCDARYDKCLGKCLHNENGGKSVPKIEGPPKTLIPEIPPNPEKLQELRKQ